MLAALKEWLFPSDLCVRTFFRANPSLGTPAEMTSLRLDVLRLRNPLFRERMQRLRKRSRKEYEDGKPKAE